MRETEINANFFLPALTLFTHELTRIRMKTKRTEKKHKYKQNLLDM